MTRVLLISTDSALEKEVAQLPLHSARIDRVASLDEAKQRLSMETFPLCLVDQRIEGASEGKQVYALRQLSPATQVILLLFEGNETLGLPSWDGRKASGEAFDDMVRQVLDQGRLTRDSLYLRAQETNEQRMSTDLPGNSEVSRGLRDRVRKLAGNNTSVLIEAEPGLDAEQVARAIHGESGVDGHFVSLQCSGLTATALADTLRGSDRPDQPGLTELAYEGTLFLDEVQALPPAVQDLLAKIVTEGEVRRRDSNRSIPVVCRWVARSSVVLKDRVRAGHFREDLYWKLCGVPLHLDPLRQRRDDIRELFLMRVRQSAARFGKPEPKVGEAVLAALKAYDFPGNEVELEELADVLVIQNDSEITLSALPVKVLLQREKAGGEVETIPIKQAVREFERQIITETLKRVRGNQSKASRRLGIHRNTLILKMQELGIPSKRKASEAA